MKTIKLKLFKNMPFVHASLSFLLLPLLSKKWLIFAKIYYYRSMRDPMYGLNGSMVGKQALPFVRFDEFLAIIRVLRAPLMIQPWKKGGGGLNIVENCHEFSPLFQIYCRWQSFLRKLHPN